MTEEELMLIEILHCRRVDLFLQKRSLNKEQQKEFEVMQRRRVQGEPLQYIIGHTEFCGFKLFVDPRVLIPRPETELMVESAIDALHQMYSGQTLKVLDLGTGCGNIAIAIAKNFPDSEVEAVDISLEALAVARRNANFHHVFERITFLHEDMNDFLQRDMEEKYDLIISNPPYISRDKMSQLPKDVQHEPPIALEAGEDGMTFIRNILSFSPGALKDSGKLIFEIWDGQSRAVFELNEYYNAFGHIEFCKDYTDTNRFVVCRLESVDSTHLKQQRIEDYF